MDDRRPANAAAHRRPHRPTGRPPRAARRVHRSLPRLWSPGGERAAPCATVRLAAASREAWIVPGVGVAGRRLPPGRARVGGSWRCARGRSGSVDADGARCRRRIRGRDPGSVVGVPARRRPTGTRLVLRAVLARVRVLLGVERPVRAGGRAVPRRAAPIGIECLGVDVVVRGRTEGRLLRTAVRLRSGRCRRCPCQRCPCQSTAGSVAAAVRAQRRVAVAGGRRTHAASHRPGLRRPPTRVEPARGRPVDRYRRPDRRSGRMPPGSRGSEAARPHRRRRGGWPSPTGDTHA